MNKERTKQLCAPEVYPDEIVLKNALGKAYKAYTLMLDLYKSLDMFPEWRYYNDGKAWLCKVQLKKKTIVWMSVWDGAIKTVCYFSAKFRDRIFDLDLGDETLKTINKTKDSGHSKPVIFEIDGPALPEDFEKIIKLKIDCK